MELLDPIIIIGAPRSGTTWLKELITLHSSVWHLPGESHHILEGPLHPKHFAAFSNRSDPDFSLTDLQVEEIQKAFWKEAINISRVKGGERLLDTFRGYRYIRKMLLDSVGPVSKWLKPVDSALVFLEKTPKNTVRIPALHSIFPSAKYIYIQRDPVDTIASIWRGWRYKTSPFYKIVRGRPRFAGAGYEMKWLENYGVESVFGKTYWRFVLPPGWEQAEFNDLLDIAAFQYVQSNRLANRDLGDLIPDERVFRLHYERLNAHTGEVVGEIMKFLNLRERDYNYESMKNMPNLNRTDHDRDLLDRREVEKRIAAFES